MLPPTCNFACGLEFPIPTLPPLVIFKAAVAPNGLEAVALATKKLNIPKEE